MKFGWFRYAIAGATFAVLGLLFFFLPSSAPQAYLSPDETAVAATARQFGTDWTLRLPDAVLKDYPWVHPRSFVTKDTALVPVGFLGLPMLMGLIWKALGDSGMNLLMPLLALSVIYPLWRFLRQLGFWAQIAVAAVWLSFPMVILYANRGLFPNLAVVSLVVWSAYLAWGKRNWRYLAAAGLLFGLAMSIRPTEIVWAIVWVSAAWLAGKERKDIFRRWPEIVAFVSAASLFPLLAAYFAWKTYGSPFLIGYWLRDPQSGAAQAQIQTASIPLAEPKRLWPFGFHPRAVWANAKSYLIYMLGPWLAASLTALAVWLNRRPARLVISVGLWTFASLCLIYGNTVYQDHVGQDIVSVGNSYLRYLLPLAPVFAVAIGALAFRIAEHWPRKCGEIAVCVLVGVLVVSGIWTAFARDDESLNYSLPEVVRYASIRYQAYSHYGRDAIVVSDRSDKIFFPTMRAVSPMPDDKTLTDLIDKYPGTVLLFDTTYGDDKIREMRNRGFEYETVLTSKNQSLYEISLNGLSEMRP